MFCALSEGIALKSLKLSNVVSLHNIVVVREEKKKVMSFLKYIEALYLLRNTKADIQFCSEDYNATYFVPGGAEGHLTVTEAGRTPNTPV